MKEEETKVWEEIIVKPTYRILKEDDLPYFDSRHYPYTKLNLFDSKPTPANYKEVIMENEYLRVTVRPELGARLFSAFSKMDQDHIFNYIDVIRPCLIASRGAWIAVGIEFNLCQYPSHTVDNFSTVDYMYRKNEDGSASIIIGNLNLTNNVRYMVTITLRPRVSRIETKIATFNTSLISERYYFWSNAGIPASAGLRLFYPGYTTNHGKFPINEQKTDLSWYKNYVRSASVFMLDSEEDFFGVYNYDNSRGVVHYGDHNIVCGKKFFTWGTSENGLFWKDLLSDRGVPYIEIQSGRYLTQGIVELIKPLASESWIEYWYPVRDLDGITYANDKISLHIEKTGTENLKIGIFSAITCDEARLELYQDQKIFHRELMKLSPRNTIKKEIKMPSGKLLLRITDSEGNEIISWNFRDYKTKLPEATSWKGEEPQWNWQNSAEELWLKGVDAEKKRPLSIAKRYFEESLEKDAGFSRSLCSLGLLYYRSGLYNKAEEYFKKALARDPYNEDASYYMGLTMLTLNRFEDAERELWKLYSGSKRSLAFYLLGVIKMKTEAYREAEEMLRNAVQENCFNLKALAMLSACLRKQGKTKEAIEVIERAYAIMPLDYLVLAEKYFLTSCKEFERIVFSGFQKVLEVSKDYMFVGLFEDSLTILKAALNHGMDNPMIHYYAGYVLKKMGKTAEAIKHYKEGEKGNTSYVFPHRLEEIDVLEDVTETLPHSPVAYYLLGNVLFYKERFEEALKKWEKAYELGLKNAILCRNLGYAYNAFGDGKKSVDMYIEAINLSKQNHMLYVELDEVYSRLDLFKERVDLLENALKECRQSIIIAKLCSALIDTGEYDKALELLMNTFFEPMEGYYGFWELYVDALIAKGWKLLKSDKIEDALNCFIEATKYPKNLGAGAPHIKYRNDVMQLYYIGLAHEKLNDIKDARKIWKEALERESSLISEQSIFKALILRKMGKKEEADALIRRIMNAIDTRMKEMLDEVGEEKGFLVRLFLASGASSVPGYRRYDEALAYLHYVKGFAYICDGKNEEGLKEVAKALEITKTLRHARWIKENIIAI